MAIERTFIALKPDAVQRGLVGEILSRFERKGLKLIGLKQIVVSQQLAETHYGEHKGKPFYTGLVSFITSGPVICIAMEGPSAVATVRKLVGKTFGTEAEPGSIRGDYGVSRGMNLIHASDSVESSARELELWFASGELCSYERAVDSWIVSDEDR